MTSSEGCGAQVPPASSTARRVSLRILRGRVSVSSSISERTLAGYPACAAACSTDAGSTPSPTIATPSLMKWPMTREVKKPRESLTTIGVFLIRRTRSKARASASSPVFSP